MTWPREELNSKPWKRNRPPSKILAIRLQAFGDMVITLPWLASLKEQHPLSRIDYLTLEKNASIARNLKIFDRVYVLKGAIAKIQFLFANLILPVLIFNRYEAVIDLQRNNISRWIRVCLFPESWSEIERFSKTLAGEKFKAAIEAIGFTRIGMPNSIPLKADTGAEILLRAGWNGRDRIIVLNPAGAYITRNWPVQNYIDFANTVGSRIGGEPLFLFLGIERSKLKVNEIQKGLIGRNVIDLTSRLSAEQSFSVIRHASIVVSEDSGLMHMAWVQRVPTLALFGSSPGYWSAPMGAWTRCLDSADLPCGNCLDEVCRFGDVHCLTRISTDTVLSEVLLLLESVSK